MGKRIDYLTLSYPNFVTGTIIDPDEANQNNYELVTTLNEFVDWVDLAMDNSEEALDKSIDALDKSTLAISTSNDASEIANSSIDISTSVENEFMSIKPELEQAVLDANNAISEIGDFVEGVIFDQVGVSSEMYVVTSENDDTYIFTIPSSHYNPNYNYIDLYKGILLTEGIDYTISGRTVTLESPLNKGEHINYRVIKNIQVNPELSDGNYLLDGSILKEKLSDEFIEEFNTASEFSQEHSESDITTGIHGLRLNSDENLEFWNGEEYEELRGGGIDKYARSNIMELKFELQKNNLLDFINNTGVGYYDLFEDLNGVKQSSTSAIYKNNTISFKSPYLRHFVLSEDVSDSNEFYVLYTNASVGDKFIHNGDEVEITDILDVENQHSVDGVFEDVQDYFNKNISDFGYNEYNISSLYSKQHKKYYIAYTSNDNFYLIRTSDFEDWELLDNTFHNEVGKVKLLDLGENIGVFVEYGNDSNQHDVSIYILDYNGVIINSKTFGEFTRLSDLSSHEPKNWDVFYKEDFFHIVLSREQSTDRYLEYHKLDLNLNFVFEYEIKHHNDFRFTNYVNIVVDDYDDVHILVSTNSAPYYYKKDSSGGFDAWQDLSDLIDDGVNDDTSIANTSFIDKNGDVYFITQSNILMVIRKDSDPILINLEDYKLYSDSGSEIKPFYGSFVKISNGNLLMFFKYYTNKNTANDKQEYLYYVEIENYTIKDSTMHNVELNENVYFDREYIFNIASGVYHSHNVLSFMYPINYITSDRRHLTYKGEYSIDDRKITTSSPVTLDSHDKVYIQDGDMVLDFKPQTFEEFNGINLRLDLLDLKKTYIKEKISPSSVVLENCYSNLEIGDQYQYNDEIYTITDVSSMDAYIDYTDNPEVFINPITNHDNTMVSKVLIDDVGDIWKAYVKNSSGERKAVVVKSIDGGDTWVDMELPSGLPSSMVRIFKFSNNDIGVVWSNNNITSINRPYFSMYKDGSWTAPYRINFINRVELNTTTPERDNFEVYCSKNDILYFSYFGSYDNHDDRIRFVRWNPLDENPTHENLHSNHSNWNAQYRVSTILEYEGTIYYIFNSDSTLRIFSTDDVMGVSYSSLFEKDTIQNPNGLTRRFNIGGYIYQFYKQTRNVARTSLRIIDIDSETTNEISDIFEHVYDYPEFPNECSLYDAYHMNGLIYFVLYNSDESSIYKTVYDPEESTFSNSSKVADGYSSCENLYFFRNQPENTDPLFSFVTSDGGVDRFVFGGSTALNWVYQVDFDKDLPDQLNTGDYLYDMDKKVIINGIEYEYSVLSNKLYLDVDSINSDKVDIQIKSKSGSLDSIAYYVY